MKRLMLFFLPFIALTINADPITSLPNGYYSGIGKYYKDSGEIGNFYSIVEINNNKIKAYKTSDVETTYGDVSITFVDDGSFTANIQKTDLTNGVTSNYTGEGYCVTDACHVYIKLGDIGFVEATMTFDFNGLISRIGSVHLANGTDDQGNIMYQVIRFEEILSEFDE